MATIARERPSSYDFEPQETTIHGHRVVYRLAGSGPPIVLIHGITSSSQTWEEVGSRLARNYTVLAPDLLGHGQSAKPRGDYSMGAFASGVRDLMLALDIGPATIVGHSLGGGVAMQFAYQFPERTSRLALVSSGGLGREVHWLLRAATLPGSELVLPLLAHERVLTAGRLAGNALDRVGLKPRTDALEMARGHASLGDAETRLAFIHTLRASLDPMGQRVRATDRLYLATQLPLLLVWGRRDKIIPVVHGEIAHRMVPGSRFEVFDGAGHFVYLDEPDRFVRLLEQWIESTEGSVIDEDQLRDLLAKQNAS
ncbi:MAG: alpha/beta fold hydrolase [Solirubrobacterales bacterium]|nr:alpha/beta fold hydrolase [Solirubrobacterales bacterium]